MLIATLVLTLSTPEAVSPMTILGAVVPLYVGPDQLMPLVSALGAIIGVLLMFWHRAVDLGRRAWRCITKKSPTAD